MPPVPSGHRKFRSFLANLLVLTISVSIGIGLAEVAVRVAAPQQLVVTQPGLFEPADSLGWIFRRDIALPVNTGERTVQIYTDGEHFRTGPRGRRAGTREVLLLGDSFIAALQVDHEQTVAGLLEATVGDSVALRNAGVPSWDPPQYLIRARALLKPGRFDAVFVFVYIGNDVVTSRRDYFPPLAIDQPSKLRLPRSLAWREIIDALARPANDWLEEHSHAFLLVKNRTLVLRMRLGLAPEYFPKEFLRETAGSDRWSVTASILHEIEGLAAQGGRPTVFVVIPAPYQTDAEAFATYARGLGLDSSAVDLDQPTRRVVAELRASGSCVIDALPTFRREAALGKRLFGTIDRHLSPQGHLALAGLAGPALAAALKSRDAREACAAAKEGSVGVSPGSR